MTIREAAHSGASGSKSPSTRAKILDFRPSRNSAGTVLAHLAVELPSGMRTFTNKLMRGPKGALWIKPPDVQRRTPDGTPVLNAAGKPIWDPIIEFRDQAARNRYQNLVLNALREAHPELFDDDGVR